MNEMKCTAEQLRQNLEEMYVWYYRRARELLSIEVDKWTVDDASEAGKATEGMDAIASIYLVTFGGKALYKMWMKTLRECAAEEEAPESIDA